MDSGYWISWYNLDDNNREEYLNWLHNAYIPKRLETKQVLWAAHYASLPNVKHPGEEGRLSHIKEAIPSGDRYILIFGATDAEVFANPAPQEFHDSLSSLDLKMLKFRIGERSNIMTEEARADGPDSHKKRSDLALSRCIQLGNFNAGSYKDEDELAAWYAQWRIPSMKKLPGCVRVRKLVSVSGWSKHAILYEWTSVEMRNKIFVDHEKTNPKMEKWTDKVVRKLVHAPGSPNLAERIWPK